MACRSATTTSYFRYTQISLLQGRVHWWPPSVPWLPHQLQEGLFSHSERLLLHPEGLYHLMRTFLRRMHVLTVSVLCRAITDAAQPLSIRYPSSKRLTVPYASKHWLALFIEVVISTIQISGFQVTSRMSAKSAAVQLTILSYHASHV